MLKGKREMGIRKTLMVVMLVISVLATAGRGRPTNSEAERSQPRVSMETSLGTITIELWPDKAPLTVENFLRYVDKRFYDGTVFHRVIKGFMIQGGGFTADMRRKKTAEPIKNEASPHLKNDWGTIAMARTGEIHSATSQFFINLVDNDFLNQRNKTPQGYGYAVFGKVIEGMDLVERISRVKTINRGSYRDVPQTPVVIKRVRRLHTE